MSLVSDHGMPCHDDLGVRQVLHARDVRRPVVDQVARANVGFDAGAAIDLHRSWRDAAELVLNRCSGMSFDDEARHAATGEEHAAVRPLRLPPTMRTDVCGVHVTIPHMRLL